MNEMKISSSNATSCDDRGARARRRADDDREINLELKRAVQN